jgi:hypothetical protein
MLVNLVSGFEQLFEIATCDTTVKTMAAVGVPHDEIEYGSERGRHTGAGTPAYD